MTRNRLVLMGSTVVLILLSGCSTLSYYGQSVIGHTSLMLSRQPLSKAIKLADESGNSKLAQRLKLAQELRDFSESDLGLPVNGSYRTFVKLDRTSPVWTVVAAEEFSVEATTWCYLVIGCAGYRGYFKESSANRYAQQLHLQGYDTSVGGAAAYSTLGWFNDPLLSSMLYAADDDLAEIIFHELAHQVLYVNDVSGFNEAFATVVAEQGTLIWLKKNRPELEDEYRNKVKAQTEFSQLIVEFKDRLMAFYSSANDELSKRDLKQQHFDQLKLDYEQLKVEHWNGRGYFDRWFEKPVNNARIAAFGTYRDRVPELVQIWASCRRDFPNFFNQLRKQQDRIQKEQSLLGCAAESKSTNLGF